MALVSVRNNYQVLIPQDVREAVGLEVGDLLEAKVESGRITLTLQSSIDSGIAESRADFSAGRSYGPFGSARGLVKSLRQESAKVRPTNCTRS